MRHSFEITTTDLFILQPNLKKIADSIYLNSHNFSKDIFRIAIVLKYKSK